MASTPLPLYIVKDVPATIQLHRTTGLLGLWTTESIAVEIPPFRASGSSRQVCIPSVTLGPAGAAHGFGLSDLDWQMCRAIPNKIAPAVYSVFLNLIIQPVDASHSSYNIVRFQGMWKVESVQTCNTYKLV